MLLLCHSRESGNPENLEITGFRIKCGMTKENCNAVVQRSRKRLATRGFTLLEVLVSLAIMAIAVTLLVQLFSANLRTIVRSGDMTSAAVRGEARIREILAGTTLAEKVWSEITADGYRMDVTISEVMKQRTDNLPVKLMEVALTVRWMEGMKEKSLHLKTMKMVDRALI
jgi:prepilin-type N-terminal cleavage/methylation domain-containing protein